MAASPEHFAQLLTEGIQRIHACEHKPISVVQDELGYLLGRQGGSAVEHWRKGRLPPHISDVEGLAQVFATRSHMQPEWLCDFLRCAGHPAPEIFCSSLVPSTDSAATLAPSFGAGIRTQQTGEAPARRTNMALDADLPLSTSSFVGRKQEMAQIFQILQNSNCRLLSLLGPGGVGKTRLALHAAREYRSSFPDGVAFIPLTVVTNVNEIAPAVISALNLPPAPAHEPEDYLASQLGARHMLLVLDNFEHLTGSALLLTRLLRRAPGIKVIVTSRARLHLQDEWVFELNGLDVPPPGIVGSTPHQHSSAVELFVQRALQVQPTFATSSSDQAIIVRICQVVRGIPLAIELAASWGRTLSVGEILREIEQNATVLATAAQDVAPRHRSLDAVFEHSWRLLSPDERLLFARLSIFRGSFTREAAVAVAQASVPLLAALIDKSLLRHIPPAKYELHELSRQYGLARLQELGDKEATTERHADYYVAAARAELELLAATQFHPQYLLDQHKPKG